MNYAIPTQQSFPASAHTAEQSRQRLITAVISFTKGINSFTEPYEQHLLDLYSRGRITIDEIVYSLEAHGKSREKLSNSTPAG